MRPSTRSLIVAAAVSPSSCEHGCSVSKPAKKRAAARNSRRRPTRARRGSTAPTAETAPELDDDDDDDDPDTLETDEALGLFVRSAPLGAERFVVHAVSHRGEEIVQDRPAMECRGKHVQIAKQVIAACERWANAEGQAMRFRAAWHEGDRALASFQWRAGSDSRELDGTVESFLAQAQRHMENREQLSFERAQIELDSFKTLIGLQNKRIEALEADNSELRDRLRKLDDVSAELMTTQMQADVAARTRTADLLEKRVFPIAAQLMLQQAQAAQQQPPQPAANGGG